MSFYQQYETKFAFIQGMLTQYWKLFVVAKFIYYILSPSTVDSFRPDENCILF